MSDELRAAAERLARDADPGRMADLGESDLFDRLRDGAAVAAAWLAEHKADDAELVTKEWLLAVGFASDGSHFRLSGWGPDRNGTVQVYRWASEWFVNGSRIRSQPTRGDVRRLAKALGVELKEGGAG